MSVPEEHFLELSTQWHIRIESRMSRHNKSCIIVNLCMYVRTFILFFTISYSSFCSMCYSSYKN